MARYTKSLLCVSQHGARPLRDVNKADASRPGLSLQRRLQEEQQPWRLSLLSSWKAPTGLKPGPQQLWTVRTSLLIMLLFDSSLTFPHVSALTDIQGRVTV